MSLIDSIVQVDDASERLVMLGTYAEPTALLRQIARLAHTASQFREALAAGVSRDVPDLR